MSTPKIVIVGGGAAGIHAARALRGLDELVTVTLVDPTGTHQFLTRLAAVAGGVAPLSAATEPLAGLLDCQVVAGRAIRVGENTVELAGGGSLFADAVIVTAGAHSTIPPIDGIRNALSLRTAADAWAIRRSAQSADAVVVVGGGPTGCQLAGALAAGPFDLFVTLIEREDSLLNGFHPALGVRAREILSGRGVSVWTGRTVEEITADSVRTSGGVAGGVPIWTGGYRAHADEILDAPTVDGRVVVDACGRVQGLESVFAAGDIAAHPVGDGSFHPMSAQVATKAGRGVAHNALQYLLGNDTSELQLPDLGWVVDLSGGQGVADVFGFPLTMPGIDRLVPLLHDAIDIRNLLQIGALSSLWRDGNVSPNARSGEVPVR